MKRGLSGKKVLITGASSGIGEGIALRFAAEGAEVAINYLRGEDEAKAVQARALELAKAMRPDAKVMLVQADVSKEGDVQRMFAQTIEQLGGLDVLVNNAGIQKPTFSDLLELEDFDRVLNVNLRGAFMCAREAIRHFLDRKIPGVILNNSSVHQLIPKPKYLSYSISKGATENLTRTLALEFADRGIRVNSVGPGAISTPINDAWRNDPKARAGVESHIPMGRAGTVEEIASVFAFLASDDASYITGQTIFADGGLTLFPEFRSAWASGE